MFKINELLKATGGRLIQGDALNTVCGISIDSRAMRPGEAFIAIKGDNFDGHNFINEAVKKGAKAIIAGSQEPRAESKERIPFILVKDTVKALTDIARFQRNKFDIPVIAVTGTNGKTTTKEMVARVLSKKFKVLKNEGTKNNQIGLSLSLLGLNSSHEIAVLELGTNHPGEISCLAKICRPNIAIITNIGPAHLEYLCDLKGVLREKYSLIKNLKKPHIGILNADDCALKKAAAQKNKVPFILSFGIKNRCDIRASKIKDLRGGKSIDFLVNARERFTLHTMGCYNIYNALAAISAARLFSIAYKDIAAGISAFNFPKSRLNFIELNRIKFIDDTYNSNPASLKQALVVLGKFKAKGRKIVVMGDMLELGGFREMFHSRAGEDISKACDIFISVGKLAKLAARAAGNYGLDTKNIFTCDSSAQARDILFNKVSVKEQDIVLVKGSRLMKMEEVISRDGSQTKAKLSPRRGQFPIELRTVPK